MTPQAGDVAFVREESLFGKIIRFAESCTYGKAHSPQDPAWWNHAALFVEDNSLVEARASGVVRWDLADDLPEWSEYMVLRPPYSSPQNQRRATQSGLESVARGTRYNWIMLLGEALKLIFHLHVFLGSTRGAICSGQVSHDLAEAGLDMGPVPDQNDPATLYAIAKQQNWQLVEFSKRTGSGTPQDRR